jgi:Ca2+-transporting ATPase
MTVTDVYFGGKKVPVDSIGAKEIIHNFCINSTANIDKDGNDYKFVGNPTECALLVCANKNGIDHNEIRKQNNVVAAYDFSSDRKMMSTAIKTEDGHRIYTKGSPENVLSLCTKALYDGKIVDLSNDIRKEAESQIGELQKQAKRILLFAYRDIDIDPNWDDNHEIDLVYVGFVGIEDPLRPDVPDAVAICRKAGVKIKILTGDNINTATAIA